jgi:antitoxin component YwqK of YwqJK toxin-antitoxin module
MYGVQFVLRGNDASRLFRKLYEAEVTARNLSRLHGTVKVYRMKNPLVLVMTFENGEKV